MEQKNCGGACCRAFTLPVDYDTLKRSYEWWLRGAKEDPVVKNGASLPFNYYRSILDIHLIFPMIIPLGRFNKTPDGKPLKDGELVEWYTCKHFNKETNLCTIYDHRPQMCRDYPYGSYCFYPGCKHERAASQAQVEKRLKEARDEIKESEMLRKKAEDLLVECDKVKL